MKPPIITNENGDVSFFESVQDATRCLEPIDVANDEYEIFDAEGFVLKAMATKPIITILEKEPRECRKDHLVNILRSFYSNIVLETKWIEDASLEQLVTHGIKEHATR